LDGINVEEVRTEVRITLNGFHPERVLSRIENNHCALSGFPMDTEYSNYMELICSKPSKGF